MSTDTAISVGTASEVEILDPRFAWLVIGHARLERLWTGARWAEGPVYVPAAKSLLWSDIPNDRVMRYDETDGSVSVFEAPAASTTATRSTARAGSSPACTAGAASAGSTTTGNGACWPTGSTAAA